MSGRRFMLWPVCIGVVIPAFFLILEHAFLRENPALSHLVMTTYRFDYVILALWPSSIILMGLARIESSLHFAANCWGLLVSSWLLLIV